MGVLLGTSAKTAAGAELNFDLTQVARVAKIDDTEPRTDALERA
nr:hypothetical protein [Candidatus Microthrix sp.]